ncbi:AraC family transcriptional regulator [Sinirhodobacter populi]|uniref:AraC family transcriptional regulator n=2 Tax=Paenirhodobacter populi TaxID=2306993 RepID=A0A443K4E5_9RHOB|nr:AraC family transcriptional regulator [Sinirhodobacter populi]
MSFRPNMTAIIEGLTPRLPLQWRALDGMVIDLWHAQGSAGGRGYYLSPDPRIVIFLDDVGDTMQRAGNGTRQDWAPLGRISYVPAGMPIWSHLIADGALRHLDLHFDARILQAWLAPDFGSAAAVQTIRRPVMLERAAEIEALAALLVAEVRRPAQHDVYVQSLVRGVVAALLTTPETATASTPLTPAQLHRVTLHLEGNLHRRVPAAELAEAAGLSESWFAHAFKRTTRETPLQWQMRRRIERAQQALSDPKTSVAEVAAMTGFADQSHLTRVFRTYTGSTPAVWRRSAAG